MGDFVEYTLNQARKKGFGHITIAAFMGKLSKIAAGSTYTHARSFTLDMAFGIPGKGITPVRKPVTENLPLHYYTGRTRNTAQA